MGMVGSCFKRICDGEIGGCDTLVDRDSAVTVQKGKLHICKICVGKLIANILDIERGC